MAKFVTLFAVLAAARYYQPPPGGTDPIPPARAGATARKTLPLPDLSLPVKAEKTGKK